MAQMSNSSMCSRPTLWNLSRDAARSRAAKLTEVLNGLDVVVAQVEGVQLLERLQVLNLVQQVHLQEEAAQLALGLQVLNPLDAIALQPEAAEACILFEVLNAVKPWWVGAGEVPVHSAGRGLDSVGFAYWQRLSVWLFANSDVKDHDLPCDGIRRGLWEVRVGHT